MYSDSDEVRKSKHRSLDRKTTINICECDGDIWICLLPEPPTPGAPTHAVTFKMETTDGEAERLNVVCLCLLMSVSVERQTDRAGVHVPKQKHQFFMKT